MDHLYDKYIQCLYCQLEFETKRMLSSRIRIKKMDSDFCIHYIGDNPIFYDVNVCPYCGLAFTDGFSPIQPNLRSNLVERYISKIDLPQLTKERDIEDALKSYKLALLCANLLKEKEFIIANLCLRIAWIYRYLKDPVKEKRFLSYALDHYMIIYESSNEEIPMEEEMIRYLIGELHFRLGNYDETKKWFSYFFKKSGVPVKWVKKTRERWQEIREIQAGITEDPEGYAEQVN